MSADSMRGWFADIDDDPDRGSRFQWQPNIQVGGAILPLPVWFETREGCERFIREEIVGQGWIDGPMRYACPDCASVPDEWCTNLTTGEWRITHHADRMRYVFGGWPA